MDDATMAILKKLMKFIVAGVFMVFLVCNIAASQFIPSSYFPFVQGDRAAAVELLKAVKPLPEFDMLLARQKEIFGPSIDSLLFTSERNRESQISKLERKLSYNSKDRDILFGLYLLYRDQGNGPKAQQYLKRAQEIDPMVGK